jgi:hypothetical protein
VPAGERAVVMVSGRVFQGSTRVRKIGIVAPARRLLIALWRFLETETLPKGAVPKAEARFR